MTIQLTFKGPDIQTSAADVARELVRYRGEYVTVKHCDHETSGTLDRVTMQWITMQTVSGVGAINNANIASVCVRVGGDWKTEQGHKPDSRVAKLVLRLRPNEKALLAHAAAMRCVSVSEFVLNAALQDAARAGLEPTHPQ